MSAPEYKRRRMVGVEVPTPDFLLKYQNAMSRKHDVILALAVVFAAIRFTIHPGSPTMIDVYKDIVHVFMGVIGTQAWPIIPWLSRNPNRGDSFCRRVFWALSAIEVAVAFGSRIF